MSKFDFNSFGGVVFGGTTLDNDEMMELIQKWTDGLCPVCFEGINEGEIICDACFERAQSFRSNGPPVERTQSRSLGDEE